MTLYEELVNNGKVLPGLTDTVFKRVMMNHRDYLGLILEQVIPIDCETIEKEGHFLNVEIPPSHLSLKANRLDLLLQIGKYYINLEANMNLSTALRIRNEAHLSGLIYNEYTRKDKKTLEEILYQIAFNKQKRLSKELIVRLKYWDSTLDVGDENILKVEFNLEFVKNKYYNKEKLSRFERALLILIVEDEAELRNLVKGDVLLEEVGNEIISYSRAKEIVTAYENQMIEENYRNNLAREQGYDKGHVEGLEAGLEAGRKEGLEAGREEGTMQSRMEIAKSMLAEGMKETLISKITGLSMKEIEELKG